MMALPTKRLYGWEESFRRLFRMDGKPTTRTAGGSSLAPSSQSRDDAPVDEKDPEIRNLHPDDIFTRPTVENPEPEMSLSEKMAKAKELYPGSDDWAKDEERLFEILYLRQDLPMLPSHWTVDFRGFPIPENIFETSDEHPPIIYAHSKYRSKEYLATASITRLVDLTLAVRTVIESETPGKPAAQRRQRVKAAELIKDALDDILDWAARDGGYDQLRTVPNIVAEIVEAPETQQDIVQFMMDRMRALSYLQREFYRVDQDGDFWSSTEPRIMGSSRPKTRSSLKRRTRAGMKRKREMLPKTPELTSDELAIETPGSPSTPRRKLDFGSKKRRILKSPPSDDDELAYFEDAAKPIPSVETDLTEGALKIADAQSEAVVKMEPIDRPLTTIGPPRTPPPKTEHRRRPPVVYGLYILGTTVFLLTADSSKGDGGYISFHVDINFADNHQSVWNALTVAIAVCSARDELMSRLDDFKPVTVCCESDPDA